MIGIASLYNASNISHSVHSTSLFSLAKVKYIRTGDYSEWTKCHIVQNGTIQCYVCVVQVCPYSANPQLDWFCHVMKSITKNKHPVLCVWNFLFVVFVV